MNILKNIQHFLSINKDPIINVHFYSPDKDTQALDLFVEYLSKATKTIDVCSFLLSDNKLISLLAQKHRENVKIRIIVDNQSINLYRKDLSQLASDADIEIKSIACDNVSFIMHHKFVIIDDVVITGTANLTHTSLRRPNSYESVNVFSEDFELLQKFKDEFNRIWTMPNCQKQF